VFDVKFIEGTPQGALSEPNTVVLTKSVADKYFPNETAVGKIIKSSGDAVKITAVVENPPINSHMPFKYLVAMPHEYWASTGWWTGNNFFTYVKLVEGASEEAFEAKMLDFMRKHMAKDLMETYHYENFDDYLASDDSYRFTLVPIQKIHLNYPRLTLAESAGSMDNVYIFSAVAFFILLIACINFINLSTARSGSRSKEVGIRKVLGSVRGELIRQFMVESFLISIF
jgi:putative ABC transport system permease protein